MDGIENKYLRVGGLVKTNSLKFLDGNWIFEVVDQNQNSVNVVFSNLSSSGPDLSDTSVINPSAGLTK